uniref:Unkown protein n=1 Tax=Riptortus pedestris TaxID=329032 RepID=R4WR86_RIPPE|nr:unkown protein [Riptortus pedestris]
MSIEISGNNQRPIFFCYHCQRDWDSFISTKACIKRCFGSKNITAAPSHMESTCIKRIKREFLPRIRLSLISISEFRSYNLLGGPVKMKQTAREKSSLDVAATTHDCSAIQLLLECGADINERNHRGETALHIAARSNCPILVKKMSELVDINCKSYTSKTPLYIAISNGFTSLVDLLLKRGAICTNDEFRAAVKRDDIEILNVLRGNNALDLNTKDDALETPLHWAAADGKEASLSWLLDCGLDINAQNKFGWTPLHFPAYDGNLNIAMILVSRGAEINRRTKVGFTPLSVSINLKHQSVSEFLELKGGDNSW